MVGAERICTDSMSSLTPSALMTHEIDPTVKIWPGYGRDEEPAEKAILFDKETARTPLPGAWSSLWVTKGYPAMVDLSVGMRIIKNRMVTQGAETAI